MKRKIRFRAVIGLVFVIVVVVGVLVLPEVAKAEIQWIAYVYDPLENPEYLDDQQVVVHIRFLDAMGEPLDDEFGQWNRMEWSLSAHWHFELDELPIGAASWQVHVAPALPAVSNFVSVNDTYEEFLVTLQ